LHDPCLLLLFIAKEGRRITACLPLSIKVVEFAGGVPGLSAFYNGTWTIIKHMEREESGKVLANQK
jgi:hypothetical protein